MIWYILLYLLTAIVCCRLGLWWGAFSEHRRRKTISKFKYCDRWVIVRSNSRGGFWYTIRNAKTGQLEMESRYVGTPYDAEKEAAHWCEHFESIDQTKDIFRARPGDYTPSEEQLKRLQQVANKKPTK